jgi:hypothetical protein
MIRSKKLHFLFFMLLLPFWVLSQSVSVQFSGTQPTCFSLPTGKITAIPIGGTLPYTFKWSNGGTNAEIINLLAGSYSVTVTDALNRSATGTYILTEPPKLSVKMERIVCGNPTTVKAVVTGGVGPYTYAWDTGSTFDTTIVNEENKYCVSVTDSRLCGNITCEPIILTPMVVAIDAKNISCNSYQDGQLVVSAGGGLQPYTYKWSNGQTTKDIRNLASGIYTVTVTEKGGCAISTRATVAEPLRLTIPLSITQPSCSGENTGRIVAQPTGGNAPYRFSWSTGSSSSSLNFLAAGSYSLTVVDAKGCNVMITTNLVSQSAINLFTTSKAETCLGMGDGELRVSPVGGVAPYRFKWNSGESDSLIKLKVTGNYVVTVTDAIGCAKAVNVLMTAAASSLIIDVKNSGIGCNGTSNGSLQLNIKGGQAPFRIQWNTGATTPDIANLKAGTYVATVTDAIGCKKIVQETMLQSSAILLDISGDDQICGNATNARLRTTVTGGVLPYTYRWSNGRTGPNPDNMGAGMHYLTLTDANKCSIVDSFFIAKLPVPAVSLVGNKIVCNNGKGALSAVVTGSPGPYLYAWSNGQTGAAVGNLSTGYYSLTVEDANRCASIEYFQIEVVDSLKPNLTIQPPRCKGELNGVIAVNQIIGGISPYTYNWNNGSTLASRENLGSGIYSLTVTDKKGCIYSRNFPLFEADSALSVNPQITDVLCGVQGTGGVSLQVKGGIAPYQHRWSDGSLTANRLNLRSGLYIITVTDAYGCPVTRNISINDPGNPVCNLAVTKPVTYPSLNNGEAQVAPSGGIAPYTVLWSNGQVGYKAVNLENKSYEITLTDAKGCITNCTLNPDISNSLVGDYVWFDSNLDGLQSSGEQGVPNVEVVITRLDSFVERFAFTQTDVSGKYFFPVPPGQYKITFQVPAGMVLTKPDVFSVNDSLDSDVDRKSRMTTAFTVNKGTANFTFDAGLIPAPQALATNTICLNNATQNGNGQFQSTLEIRNEVSGQTWRILNPVGIYDQFSLPTPNLPRLISNNTLVPEVEPGLYQYKFRHIDGKNYTALVTNGIDTMLFKGGTAYPEIPITNLPLSQLSLCENGGTFKFNLDTSVFGNLNITLNGKLISEINPAELGKGTYNLEINFNTGLLQECITILDLNVVVQKDSCLAKLGDRVWHDLNQNGIQNQGEPGLRNVQVILSVIEGNKIRQMDTTYTDSTGMYMFNVPSGKYKLTFAKPNPDYAPTSWLRGSDKNLDSDMSPFNMMTEFITIDTGVNRMDIDAGFYLECKNVTSGGEIGYNQLICGPGNDPVKIVNVVSPSGAIGDLEYLWMYTNDRALTFDMNLFSPIPNSDSPEYDPGPLYQTTYYARCVRKRGCYGFLESNVIKIEVGNRATVKIISSPTLCVNANNFLEVQTSTSSAQVTWELGPGFQSTVAYGSKPNVRFTGVGTFNFKVTVVERECTVYLNGSVTVTNNPTYCPSVDNPETMSIEAEVMPGFDVKLTWRNKTSGYLPVYTIEKSMDGIHFTRIIDKKLPVMEVQDMKYFEFVDKPDKMGLQYYRVKMKQEDGTMLPSNIEKVMLMDKPDMKMMAFPNPVDDILHVEYYLVTEENIEISLFDANGLKVRDWQFPPGPAVSRALNVKDLAPGVYAIRIISGSGSPISERIIKH